jgi:hypothetical protein
MRNISWIWAALQVLPVESRYQLLAMSKPLRQSCFGCWRSSDLMALTLVGSMSHGGNNPAARFTPRTSTWQV